MAARLSRRERLTEIFYGRVPDRSAVKLWGAAPGREQSHPGWERVRRAAVAQTDLFVGAGSPFDLYAGRHAEEVRHRREEPTDSPEWVRVVTTWQTPEGELREVFQKSTVGKPGYEVEHLLKEPDDIRKLLSLPYEPHPFDRAEYDRVDAEIGDRGLAFFGLDHAMYGLQRHIGSENFALWSLEAEAEMRAAMTVFAERVRDHARAALDAGVRGVFGWVGPELCIPPLMPPAAFEAYVFDLDKPLTNLIHDAGGAVWVHSHGRMKDLLVRFADLGIDVLNPIEPPPMGDITLAEAFAAVGDRMGLEGNLETHDLMTGTPETLRPRLEAALAAGRGRRHILCPSSGYAERPDPGEQEIENWLFFIEEGVSLAEELAPGAD